MYSLLPRRHVLLLYPCRDSPRRVHRQWVPAQRRRRRLRWPVPRPRRRPQPRPRCRAPLLPPRRHRPRRPRPSLPQALSPAHSPARSRRRPVSRQARRVLSCLRPSQPTPSAVVLQGYAPNLGFPMHSSIWFPRIAASYAHATKSSSSLRGPAHAALSPCSRLRHRWRPRPPRRRPCLRLPQQNPCLRPPRCRRV